MTNFEKTLRDALSGHTEEEIKEYFETQFLKPLNTEMDNDASKIPAEYLRQKRQQTNHVKNIFLTLRRK